MLSSLFFFFVPFDFGTIGFRWKPGNQVDGFYFFKRFLASIIQLSLRKRKDVSNLVLGLLLPCGQSNFFIA
jgi:hypothetical protein